MEIAAAGRDRPRCTYCGHPVSRKVGVPGTVPRDAPVRPFTLDHIVTKAAGGTNHRANLAPACDACNGDRGDMPLDLFIERLGEKAAITLDQARSMMARATSAVDAFTAARNFK